MSHAPLNTYFYPTGDSTIQGCFTHKEFNTYFEFSSAAVDDQCFGPYYDSKVWVREDDYRLARVLKTVAYVVVDEGNDGPVIEKWPTKKFLRYEKPQV